MQRFAFRAPSQGGGRRFESGRSYQKPQVSPLFGWPFFLTGARGQEKVKNRSWFCSSNCTRSPIAPNTILLSIDIGHRIDFVWQFIDDVLQAT